MNRYDNPIAWEALNAHDEDVWRRRDDDIRGLTKRRRRYGEGDSSYVATVEKRIEWIRGYLDEVDYDMAAAFAERTLAMSMTSPQRATVEGLRESAESGLRRLGRPTTPSTSSSLLSR